MSWSQQSFGQVVAAPLYQWARAAKGTDDGRGVCTGVDAQGSAYVSGLFSGAVTFGPNTFISRGDYDIFLAKYSASGLLLWARQIGGPGRETVGGLTVEAGGTVYLTGNFTLDTNAPTPIVSLTLGNVTLIAGSRFGEMFLASYDALGTLNWAKQTKGTGRDASTGAKVASDGSGNIYVIGHAEGHATFDSFVLQLSTNANTFVAKYSRAGVLQWVTTGLGNAFANNGEQLAVDATGQCYVLANFDKPLSIAGTTLIPSQLPAEAYLAKLDAQGQVLWAQLFGPIGDTKGLVSDAQGNLLVGCSFVVPVVRGNQTFTSRGGTDLLVMQYSPQGVYRWGVQFGGSDPMLNSDQWHGLSVDTQGNSYLSLGMWGMSTLTQASGTNQYFAHLASLTATGTLRWARVSTAVISDLAATAAGNVYTTGHIEDTCTFDAIALTTAQGVREMYVAKLEAVTVTSPTSPTLPTPTPPAAMVWLPNLITPNGDGLNETFRFTGLGVGPWQLQVYSRWGRLVYQHENYQQDWGAAEVPTGVYYYHLQAPQQPSYQGWLEVVH